MITKPKSISIDQDICSICHRELGDYTSIHESIAFLGLVCRDCEQKFSKRDIEFMIHWFKIYGGYFGQRKMVNFSISYALREIMRDIGNNRGMISPSNLEVRMMHKALLHGISPSEFNARLREVPEM